MDASIWKAVRGAAVWATPVAVLLLVPAGLTPGGAWLWPRGLAFVGAYGAVTVAGNVMLAIYRPDHLRVRQQGVVASREKRQPLIDAIGVVVMICLVAGWLAFIPIDVFRLHLFPAPNLWLSSIGGLAAILGAALTPIAVWENRFATPNVQDQPDQQIVDTGVYGLIRHPIYLGNLLLFAGAALWLGSYAALIGVGAVLLSTVGRIALEERHLRARVPAYEAYANKVRARLIPFVL